MKVWLASVLALFVLASQCPAEEELSEELQEIQGAWEQVGKTRDGRQIRILKEIDRTRETVTVIDKDGNLLHSHAVDFEIKKLGKVRVFTYRNYTVIAGPHTGQTRPGGSYIYRVVGDTFREVTGFLEGDTGKPSIVIWKRVKPSNQQANNDPVRDQPLMIAPRPMELSGITFNAAVVPSSLICQVSVVA